MTQTNAECTVRDSWWWAEELPETCIILSKNKFEILEHLDGFVEKKNKEYDFDFGSGFAGEFRPIFMTNCQCIPVKVYWAEILFFFVRASHFLLREVEFAIVFSLVIAVRKLQ